MKILFQYFKERFPIGPVLLFATGYAGLVIGISFTANPWIVQLNDTVKVFFLTMGIFVCFLLRQRAVDEFRDFKHDLRYFPNRPVQRGLIDKHQILLLGITAFTLELYFVSNLGLLRNYLIVVLFTFLMAKDFFIKKWLDKHFTTHFFIHELFFFIFGWFFINTFRSENTTLSSVIVYMLILQAGPMSIELVRKYKPRYDLKGKVVRDTYSTVWGRTRTILFLMILTLITGICLSIIKSTYEFLLIGLIMIYGMYLARKLDKFVMVLGAGQYLLYSIFANLLW